MGMRIDIAHGDNGLAAASAGDANPPMWKLGSRIATRNVRATRKAYLRCAEVAERVLNDVDSTTCRVSQDVLAMASDARDALHRLRGTDTASVPREPGGHAAALKAKGARADLRDIALCGQIAADTNVRAYLDHLDDLAKAPNARTFVSTQSSYFWDQWQRSLRQVADLQQRTVGALRKIASAPTA